MPRVFPAKAHGNYLKKGVGVNINSFEGGSATRRALGELDEEVGQGLDREVRRALGQRGKE